MMRGTVILETGTGEGRRVLVGHAAFAFVGAQLPTPGEDFSTQVQECLTKIDERLSEVQGDGKWPAKPVHIDVQLTMPTTTGELSERKRLLEQAWNQRFPLGSGPTRTIAFVMGFMDSGIKIQMTPTIAI